MAHAYYLYKLRGLPSEDRFASSAQMQLLLQGIPSRESAQSMVQKVAAEFLPSVSKYSVRHDYLVNLQYPGRVSDLQFDQFLSRYDFPMYVDSSAAGGERTLIVRTKKLVAADFITRMGVESGLHALERQIDFDALRPQLATITGGWFKNVQAANLRSTGVFGDNVDRSEAFRTWERIGTLHMLYFPYPREGRSFPISINSNGGVVLQGSFDTEEEALDLVLHIKRNLLDPCWAQ